MRIPSTDSCNVTPRRGRGEAMNRATGDISALDATSGECGVVTDLGDRVSRAARVPVPVGAAVVRRCRTTLAGLVLALVVAVGTGCTAGPTPHPQDDVGEDAGDSLEFGVATQEGCGDEHDVVDWDNADRMDVSETDDSDGACEPTEADAGPTDVVDGAPLGE